METVTHPPVVDIESQQPLDRAIALDREIGMGLSEGYFQRRSEEHGRRISNELGTVELALAITQLEVRSGGLADLSIDEVMAELDKVVPDQREFPLTLGLVGAGTDKPVTVIQPRREFVEYYLGVSGDPKRKLEVDSDLAVSLLTMLGPTNRLSNKESIDAGIDIATIAQLLRGDFESIPTEERSPKDRLVEAYLMQELALLWKSPTFSKLSGKPFEGHMFNIDDPNVFTEEQIDTIPAKERWKIIGAKLADESADLYSEIMQDTTAGLDVQLEAACRMTDMRVRALRIKQAVRGVPGVSMSVEEYTQKAGVLNMKLAEKLVAIDEFRKRNPGHSTIPNGLYYELISVVDHRDEILKSTDSARPLVRLALIREDSPHINSPIYDTHLDARGQARDEVQIKFSTAHDVVEEDINGNVRKRLQVKAMSQAALNALLDAEHKRYVGMDIELRDPNDSDSGLHVLTKQKSKL